MPKATQSHLRICLKVAAFYPLCCLEIRSCSRGTREDQEHCLKELPAELSSSVPLNVSDNDPCESEGGT